MKIDRCGRAKILSTQELALLFNEGLNNHRDRTLFAIMLYSACRISEVVTLKTKDVYHSKGRVRPELIIRKNHTKGKLATRTIPIIEDLRLYLQDYKPARNTGYLFPGQTKRAYLHSDSAALILRKACKRVDLEGVSTHSFRRTALTQMSRTGIPLRTIQEISGHRTLDELYKYLEVTPEEVRGAVSALSLLTPSQSPSFVKPVYDASQSQQEQTRLTVREKSD